MLQLLWYWKIVKWCENVIDGVLVKEMTVKPRTDSDLDTENDEVQSDWHVHSKAEGTNVFSAGIWLGSVVNGGAHMVFPA